MVVFCPREHRRGREAAEKLDWMPGGARSSGALCTTFKILHLVPWLGSMEGF